MTPISSSLLELDLVSLKPLSDMKFYNIKMLKSIFDTYVPNLFLETSDLAQASVYELLLLR